MSGSVDGSGCSVNWTTTLPAANAAGGTVPWNFLMSPCCWTLSLKPNFPSRNSCRLTLREEMTCPCSTSPRITIRAKVGYWPICVGASAFHTPQGKLPTMSHHAPRPEADWNSYDAPHPCSPIP